MMAATKHTKAFYNTEIPSDWTTPEFGDVFDFLKTFSFSREQLTSEYTNDGIRNIHYGDIHATYQNEILDLDIEKTVPYLQDGLIDPKNFDDESFPALKEGDLIIADASEDYEGVCDCVELKNINGSKVVSGLHTFAARTSKEKIALGYRTYTLKQEQVVRELRRIATGTSVYGVSKANLSKVKIPLPPLPEQKAIAQVLSTADAAIHTTEKLIAQKELRKKWLMQQLLTGKKRLMGFEGEWKEIKLGDIGEIKTSSVDKVLLEEERIVNLVNYMDVYRNRFISPEFECKKTSANEREINTFNLRKGDILFTPSSETPDDIGHSAVVTADLENTVYSYHLVRFRLFQETALAYNFRAYVFNNQNILNEFSRRATGSTRFTISKSDFEEIKTKIPPTLEEQTAIAQLLQAADKEISLLKAKAEKLREQKKGLMQVLLTGKVRLKIN